MSQEQPSVIQHPEILCPPPPPIRQIKEGVEILKPKESKEFGLSNDELVKAIMVTMKSLSEHHIKYNLEVLRATEKHYIALINEELGRVQNAKVC